RERCKEEIAKAGLPIPVKSACYFCPAMQPYEVAALPRWQLQRIVIMEARARPRLRKVQGLWRNGTKGTRGGQAKPGSITEFIRQRKLLPAEEIDRLIQETPVAILRRQDAHRRGESIPDWDTFLTRQCA